MAFLSWEELHKGDLLVILSHSNLVQSPLMFLCCRYEPMHCPWSNRQRL